MDDADALAVDVLQSEHFGTRPAKPEVLQTADGIPVVHGRDIRGGEVEDINSPLAKIM
jgi:hypothetical protein